MLIVYIGPASLTKVTADLCQQGMCKLETAFLIAPTEEDKLTHLGLNSHLKASVAVSVVKDPLWFADYLSASNCADVATVAVHLKAVHRRETWDPQDFAASVKAKQHFTFDRPTHIISEVVHGFNAVIVLEIESKDQKTFIANKMYLEAKKLFSNPLAVSSMDDFQFLKMAKFHLHTDLKDLAQHDDFLPCLKSIWSLLRGDANFVPVELTLSSLPTQTSRDMEPDLEKKLFSLKHNLKQVQSICQLQIEDEFLTKFPNSVSPLLRLEEFKKCIEAIDDDISCTIASKLVSYRNCGIGPDDILDVCRDVYDAFFVNDVLTDWLVTRQNEILSLKFLLKDISLPFHTRELELEELDIGQHVKSFVFRIVRVEDDLVSNLKLRLCLPDGVGEEFPCFEVLTLCGEEQDIFIKSLQSFCDQVFKSQCDASLIASEHLIGGTVKSLNRTDVPPPLARAQSLEDFEADDAVEEKMAGTYDSIYQKKSPCVAKDFIAGSRVYQDGHPVEYLLRPDVKKTRNEKFRWFSIGKPDGRWQHKVIVLMGATGAGKSTLIDGMVNYILGVEWNDPFRFRMVYDVVQNKYFSRTSSVTAYTIRHKDGMRIPYDLTVVDTPGYGDVRGVDHDLEIDRLITEFMAHPETKKTFDSVDAVCFVGRASDAKLSPSQERITESMVEIFGNDICRQGCELFVTFCDGGKPPILEAFGQLETCCFPHHKFNNSALYSPNDRGMSLYWEMGSAHYDTFFARLTSVPKKKKKCAELSEIELQLEMVLSKMDTFANFRQIVDRLGSRLETCWEDFDIEVEEAKLTKLDCRPFWSYNCRNCSLSCVKSLSAVDEMELVLESCSLCSCPAAMHIVDDFLYSWCLVKAKKTLKAIKEEELGCSSAVSVQRTLVKLEKDLQGLRLKARSLLEKVTGGSKVADYVEKLKIGAKDACRIDTLDQLMNSPEDGSGRR